MGQDANKEITAEKALFYQYGAKPIAKEFQAFHGKVEDSFRLQGFTKQEAFIAWQLFKLNVNLINAFKENIHYNALHPNVEELE